MLDIDYCDGKGCSMRDICQRYTDYLFKKSIKQSVAYAKNGESANCFQFKPKAFTGD